MFDVWKTGSVLTVLLVVASAAFAGGAQEPPEDTGEAVVQFEAYTGSDGLTADDIMRDAETSLIPADVRADVTMTLINRAGSRRIREISMISKEEDELNKIVMHFRSPADVEGTGFLMLEADSGETDMWLYLPDLSRVRRIVSSSKTESFMGSDISYSDMEDKPLDDYRYVRLQDDVVNGEACFVVESTPASDAVASDTGYSRIIHWISRDKMIPLQAAFFDPRGTYFKQMQIQAVEEIGGTWIPTLVEVEVLREGHRTIMELRNVQVDTNPDDSYFTQQYLQRGN